MTGKQNPTGRQIYVRTFAVSAHATDPCVTWSWTCRVPMVKCMCASATWFQRSMRALAYMVAFLVESALKLVCT